MDRPVRSRSAKCARPALGASSIAKDYLCSRSQALSAERWADDVRLSDIEGQFVCSACGKRGADVRPDFDCNERTVGTP
jgi:hypothetical protein